MDICQLHYILHGPTEDHGWMYRAEAPALQGCVAWGKTPEETLKSLLAVAQTIIQVCREDGQALPPELTGDGPDMFNEDTGDIAGRQAVLPMPSGSSMMPCVEQLIQGTRGLTRLRPS